MIHLLVHLLVNALIILAVSRILPGVKLRSFGTAVAVALVLGVLNVLLGKLLVMVGTIVALPAILLTFGLAYLLVRFVVNCFLLWLTDKIIAGFEIDGLNNLMLASLLISVLQHVALRFIY
jgi:putative membrane protein